MQYLLKTFLLTSLLALIGCGLFGADGNEKEGPPAEETYFTATVNGQPWEAGGGSANFTCIGDAGLVFRIGSGKRTRKLWPYHESLALSVAYEGPGTYSLVEPDDDDELRFVLGSSYTAWDGDVPLTGYSPTDDSSANQLKITSYDPEGGSTKESRRASSSAVIETAGIVEGTFRTTVVVVPEDVVPEPGEPPRRQPDTLRFTEGRFRVGVVEVLDALEECGPLPEGRPEE